jgi:hypothetical protein
VAFVSGYDHDIFVSYAHLDNEGEPAWVDTLLRRLGEDLTHRLGTRNLSIWIDHAIEGNRPLTPAIMQSIKGSATLLVVMSMGYLASEWCTRERSAFLGLVKDCVADGRIFIVDCWETDLCARPPEFGDLTGFKFWTHDPDAAGATRTLGSPDVTERAYNNMIVTLSDRIAKTLTRLRAKRTDGTAAAPSAPCIFVARSTDDLEDREEELKGYASQAGLEVLPQTWYPESSEADFRAAMEADLKQSALYVQLLGPSRGRKAQFAGDKRYPALQHQIAAAAGKPVFQWRHPGEDLATSIDDAHRALVEGARAEGFEDFKAAVVAAARSKPPAEKIRSPRVSVFVNADRDDLDVARQLAEVFAARGVECYWPIFEGSPERVRQDLEDNLSECDGLVLIYGASEPAWIRDQLRQGRKILSQRERALAALAIYLGPPPQEKKEIAVALPDLLVLDGRTGVNPASLLPFVQKLTTLQG